MILRCLSILLGSTLTLSTSAIELREQCPKYFEKISNSCQFVSLYQTYTSVQSNGLGGTTTGLPNIRDGFDPRLIDLGRYLFFDPILSGDQSRSCASCHDPRYGFTDGRAKSLSTMNNELPRSAPSLWNTGFSTSLFWDGRASSLEAQALSPIIDPLEMNGNIAEIEARATNTLYLPMFRALFPHIESVSIEHITSALAAFQASLVSFNSRYDRYAHGDHDALNQQEVMGLNVFRSFVARCAECHTPPLFTNNQIAVIGTPVKAGEDRDLGAGAHFNQWQLNGGFKVPTLRNIAKTAPYMHNGDFETLNDVVTFYNGGRGHAVSEDEDLLLHWHIVSPNLRVDELDALVAFLNTLNDETAMPDIPTFLPSGLNPMSHRLTKEEE